MGEKGLMKIKNLKELDIPVDVQVARFTIYTGCLQLKRGSFAGCIHEPPIQPSVEEVWRRAAKAMNIAPWELDEPMWTIGSKLCSRSYCSPCPVQHLCAKNFCVTIQGSNVYWKK
jgi:N-glycosylase/DNA lyase